MPHSVAVGSYRRGCARVGDLDVLVRRSDDKSPDDFVRGYASRIRRGSYLFSTVPPFDGSRGTRRDWIQVDVWTCTPADAAYALLHYTGSKGHNIGMRRLAQSRGWKLNQYGLYNSHDVRFPARSEQEIFRLLGKPYKQPMER